MTAESFYRYLMWARRKIWVSLEALPDEALSKAVSPADGMRCIKDFVAHIAMVEDGWFQGDLLVQPLMMDRMGREAASDDAYWHHQNESLESLLAYWRAVESDTLACWSELMAVVAENRTVKLNEDLPETMSADEVVWHVMQHEVRHTAQIVQMIRLLGHKPPGLDLSYFKAEPSGDVSKGES
jgi:uncharacterized damage-inducible protein DinB